MSPSTTRRSPPPWTARRIAVAAISAAILIPLAIWVGRQIKTSYVVSSEGADVAFQSPLELFNLDDLRIPKTRILHGGPPKDGIPALSNPETIGVDRATHLDDEARVIGITIGTAARAYPIRLLDSHEAVNDTLGGVPILVVYCPLCDSVTLHDRRIDGATLEFGISGLLYESNVLLFDRTDDALWSQIEMQAVSGPHAGRAMKHLAGWTITSFARWRDANPESDVLTFNTGHDRTYDASPYDDYRAMDAPLFSVSARSELMPAKTPVIGIVHGNEARCYAVPFVRDEPDGTITDTFNGGTIQIRVANGNEIELIKAPENARVIHTFWFAWYAAHPNTNVFPAK